MELKFHVQPLSEEPASAAEADSHAHYIVRLGMILLLLARVALPITLIKPCSAAIGGSGLGMPSA
jgi:hypothetical protein